MMLVKDGGRLRQMKPLSKERCQKCMYCCFSGKSLSGRIDINRCSKPAPICENVAKTFDLKDDMRQLAELRRLLC